MNAFVMLRQAPQPVAPIVPQYTIDGFPADGVVVQVHNQDDDTTSEFLVDWDADRESATMNATCTLTVFAEDGKTLSEEEIKTPDWIHYAIPCEVEDYLIRCAEERYEDNFCY